MQLADLSLHPIYWLGGSFSGGKTTTCRALAERFGLRAYHYDHDLLTDEDFAKFRAVDEEWFWLPVEHKLERYRRAFGLAFERVIELAEAGPVIAEGPGLLPELLAARGVRPGRATFLLPTPVRQRAANNERRKRWRRDVLEPFDDPDLAWQRWMELDDEFTHYLAESAGVSGYAVIWNDGSKSVDAVADEAACRLGLR